MKIGFRVLYQSIIILFFIIILFVQWNFFVLINSTIEKANSEYSESIVKSVSYEITSRIRQLDRVSNMVSQNRNMQMYVVSQDETEKRIAYNSVFNEIWNAIKYTDNNMYIMAWNNDGKKENVINTLDSIDSKLVEKFFKEYKQGILRSNVRIYVEDNSIIVCKFKNIDMYNLSTVGIDRIGTVGVVSKINILELQNSINAVNDVSLALVNETTEDNFSIFSAEIPKGRNNVKTVDIDDTQWRLVCTTSLDRIPNMYSDMRNLIVITISVCVAFFLVLMFVFHYFFSRPLKKVFKYFDGYSLDTRKQRIKSVGTTELDTLLHHTNDMLDVIEKYTFQIIRTQEQLYEKELEEKNARLSMYQMQIQPHFLYNTLGCINAFALDYGADEILDITSALADIFRYSMESEDTVSLGDELKYLQCYLEIQKKRFPSLFELRIDVDEDLLSKRVPKMILQPIVENSFKHGISIKQSFGIISIVGKVLDDKIEIVVRDDGVGIAPERLSEIRTWLKDISLTGAHNQKIGLVNVYKRIILHYGPDYGLEINSEKNKFTEVKIYLPIENLM